MKIEAHVRLNDQAFEETAEALYVYIVPFEVSLFPNNIGLNLQGLILKVIQSWIGP